MSTSQQWNSFQIKPLAEGFHGPTPLSPPDVFQPDLSINFFLKDYPCSNTF